MENTVVSAVAYPVARQSSAGVTASSSNRLALKLGFTGT